MSLEHIITVDKEIAGGVPVFRGTRVAIKTLFDYLEEGSLEEFLQGFPTVTRQQAEAVIEAAADSATIRDCCMKILLDENIDVRFKASFPDTYDVQTVRDMGWTGVKNGALLQLLAQHGFDCWIVVDKNIPYQQNLSKLPCTIIVLDVFRNTLMHLAALMSQLLEALDKPTNERLIIISEIK